MIKWKDSAKDPQTTDLARPTKNKPARAKRGLLAAFASSVHGLSPSRPFVGFPPPAGIMRQAQSRHQMQTLFDSRRNKRHADYKTGGSVS